MVPPASGRAPRPIRLAILDDNPFVASPGGEIRPRAATFHRFAAAVVAAGPFERASYLVPVRELAPGHEAPDTLAVDAELLEVVPTAPFDGVAGYLRRAPWLARRNWPVIRAAVRQADLVWIKAPASNALLALIAARRSRRPYFTWVAGSARDVVAGQRRSLAGGLLAGAAAIAYDGVTGLLRRTGPSIALDATTFTSLVSDAEVAATRNATPARVATAAGTSRAAGRSAPGVRLVWAGRVVEDKGIDDLLAAVAALRNDGVAATLDLVGDGPDRERLARSAASDLDGAVRWRGFVGDRAAYLDCLREGTVFVLPSRAEGVPKVAIDAMAAGVPVVATRVGAVAELLGDGLRGVLVPPRNPRALASAIAGLADRPDELARLREAGLAFAAEHTLDRQAVRVVEWMRATFPRLPWPATTETQAE